MTGDTGTNGGPNASVKAGPTDALAQFVLVDLPAPLGHVLHIGAGHGGQLASWHAAGATGITLVEPNPEAVETLHEIIASLPPRLVEVVAAAVSADAAAGRGELYRFNFSDLASLHPATGLAALFPGLRPMPSEQVDLRNPVDLVQSLRLTAATGTKDSAHVLLIEAPGEALAILESLAAAGKLTVFSRIVVQEGREVLYKNQGPLAALAEFLRSQDYGELTEDAAEQGRPHLKATRDQRAVELAERRTRQKELEEALNVEQRKVEEADRLRTEAQCAAEAKLSALSKELEALRRAQKNLQEALNIEQRKVEKADRLRTEAAQAQRAAEAKLSALSKEQETLRRAQKNKDLLLDKRDHQLVLARDEMLKAQGQIEFLGQLLLKDGDP